MPYVCRVRPLLLLSLLIGTFVLPTRWTAGETPASFGRVLRATAALVLFYIFALIVIVPRLP
ncbi:MAG: hypothetical protein AMXMBFR57_16570 [Acidimicrobiia bacterium]